MATGSAADLNEAEIVHEADGLLTGGKLRQGTSTVFGDESSQTLLAPVNHVDIDFVDLTYNVKPNWYSKERKCLLKAVSGSFRHGELVAIMGPSGAGKSTLMNVLAGYKMHGVSGEVRVNGQKRDLAVFRRISAYIMQSDHILENLTVKEAMTSAANLKLSRHVSAKQKKMIVDGILSTLGLMECRHTRGNRLSGGQRKRLSIAQELIYNPPVMFFDEPTSGLDAQTCLQCISILKALSVDGRTVVCTIHQPSARVFEMFDKLYMLSGGQCIYRGYIDRLVPYLDSFGFKCPPYHNPADFVIEVASGVYGDHVETLSKAVTDGSCEKDAEQRLSDQTSNGPTLSNRAHRQPASSFRNGVKATSPLLGMETTEMVAPMSTHYSSSYAKQFLVLYHRTFICILRDTNLTQLRFVIHLTVGVLIGLLYYDIGNKATKVMNNAACMFFSVMFLMFTAMMPTVVTFPLEMDVLIREHLNYWYSLKSYFCAKSMADCPFQIIFPVIYGTIVYWMTGQTPEMFRFLMVLTMNILVSLAAQSCGLLIGAATPVQVAVFLGPVTAIPILLFSGFFVSFSTIPWYLKWCSYASYVRYSFEGCLHSAYGFNRTELECEKANFTLCIYRDPNLFLEAMDIGDGEYWIDAMVLIGFCIAFRITSFIVLWIQLKIR